MATILDLDTQISSFYESGYSSASSPSVSVFSNDSSCHGLDNLQIVSDDDISSMVYGRNFVYSDVPMNSTAQLVIIEEPVEKFRFRYKSEMHGTHGSLMGCQTEKSNKTFPTVELRGYNGKAIIRCSLYQVEVPQPHSHRLVVRRGDEDINDPHDVSVSPEDGFRAVFQGMGIIHTAKKHIVEELISKKEKEKRFELGGRPLTTREQSQIKLNADKEAKAMNLNQVRLGFQAFGVQNDGSWVKLCDPIFSNPINNMKSALTGELKISRMSTCVSSAAGHDDLFLFVEKVGKKNIKVRFYELNKYDEEIWEGYGTFCEADVHHQYAIALHTPPYKNPDIEKSVEVYIQLVRPSDDDRSPPLPFKFKPRDCVFSRKRARMSSSAYSSAELPESVLLANSGQSDLEPKTISQEYGKDQILSDILRSIGSLDSGRLSEMISPELLLDGVGSNKTSVIQRAPVTPKIEKKSQEQFYQTMRQSRSIDNDDRANAVRKTIGERNALHHAIAANNATLIRKLLTLVNNLEIYDVLQCVNDNQETCLHFACLYDLAEYIRPLINLGADPNIPDSKGNTPLHIAVEENRALCVSKIIDKSSYTSKSKPLNIDLQNHEGLTPLYLAARKKNLPLVRKLLEVGGASTKIVGKNGTNILHIAVEENDKDMVRYLVENTTVRVDEPNTYGRTPYQLAKGVQKIHPEILEILGKYCPDVYASDMSQSMSMKNSMELEENSSTDEDDDDKSLRIDEEETDNIFSEKCMEELSSILNQGDQWKKLAQQLRLQGTFIQFCENDANPSKTMLGLVNSDGSHTLDAVIKILKNLKLDNAVRCIMKYQAL